MRKTTSLRNLSGITARKCAYSAVPGGTATTLPRAHTEPPRGYRSLSPTGTGESLRKSDLVPVDGNGSKTPHSRTSDGSGTVLTERKKITSLRRTVLQDERHEAKRAKKHRGEGPPYWKLSTSAARTATKATRTRHAGELYYEGGVSTGKDEFHLYQMGSTLRTNLQKLTPYLGVARRPRCADW